MFGIASLEQEQHSLNLANLGVGERKVNFVDFVNNLHFKLYICMKNTREEIQLQRWQAFWMKSMKSSAFYFFINIKVH